MRTLNGRLLDLVRELDGLGKQPTLAALGHALQRASLTPADVAAYVQPNPRSYNRVPVVVRDAYDLLVMTWLPGQASVPHDHSGSICAMHVVQGEAVEGCYHVAPDGYVDLQYETPVRCGEVLAGQDAGVHTICNSSPTGELLVTVHVYSPPLRDIRQFRPRPEPPSEVRDGSRIARRPSSSSAAASAATMAAAQTLRRARQAGLTVKVVLVERRGAIGEGRGVQHAGIGPSAECPGRTHERLARSPGRFRPMGVAGTTARCGPPISFRASGTGNTCASRC